jgi:hypothetical protein
MSAKFFDNSGNVATASLPLGFYCGANKEDPACGRHCIDIQHDDKNCGACGHDCTSLPTVQDSPAGKCNLGVCAETTPLKHASISAALPSCDDACGMRSAGAYTFACAAVCDNSFKFKPGEISELTYYDNGAGPTPWSSTDCTTPAPLNINVNGTPYMYPSGSCCCRVSF